jgi:neutral/alkaline ceramidase-like enzyme
MKRFACLFSSIILCSVTLLAGDGFRAGAARVDITPPPDSALQLSGYASRTDGFKGIHDRLYTRAIVIDDGNTKAVIVTWDLIFFSNLDWERISGLISEAAGVPRENILLAATHTHGAPNFRYLNQAPEGSPGKKYLAELDKLVVQAVNQAQADLKPARIGYGAGEANVNMNRVARMAEGDFWLGKNPDGVSDKSVGVIRFEDLAGKPIAFFINYAVHGTVMGPKNYEITADLPGAVSRFVERQFGDDVVAAFTAGASGDQDPIYRVGTDFGEVEVLGRILGAEAARVAESIETRPGMRIGAAQRVVTCPGRKQAPGQSRRQKDGNYKFVDADPVNIRIAVLKLNHIAITSASGEVLTRIGSRAKEESPLRATLFATHANGSSGYIPDEESFKTMSYETAVSKLKPGCAEDAIVEGLMDMIDGL